jgi:hypothetical protein
MTQFKIGDRVAVIDMRDCEHHPRSGTRTYNGLYEFGTITKETYHFYVLEDGRHFSKDLLLDIDGNRKIEEIYDEEDLRGHNKIVIDARRANTLRNAIARYIALMDRCPDTLEKMLQMMERDFPINRES